MVSTMNLLIMTLKIFGLLILCTNQVSTSDNSDLLSRLYKKGADSNRPIIIVFNNKVPLPRNKDIIKRPNNVWDVLFNELDNKKGPIVTDYLSFKKKRREPKKNRIQYKGNIGFNALDQHFEALLPLEKSKKIQKKKGLSRSPIIKSLLRISNNLRCEARDECANECGYKYGNNEYRQSNCQNTCEVKYECKEPEQDPCEDNECQESSECVGAACQGSTKGWSQTEKPRCPDC